MTWEMVFSCTHQPFHFANYSFYATRMHSTLFYFPVIGREQLKLKEKISGWGRRYAYVSLTDGPQLSPSALHTGAVAPALPMQKESEQRVVSNLFFSDMGAVCHLKSWPVAQLTEPYKYISSSRLFTSSFPPPKHIFI